MKMEEQYDEWTLKDCDNGLCYGKTRTCYILWGTLTQSNLTYATMLCHLMPFQPLIYKYNHLTIKIVLFS